MVGTMKLLFATVLPVILAACGPAGNDPGPGGVTVDEAKALDEAAEMLEQRRLPEDALSKGAVEGAAANAETPAASPDPAPTPQP
jgi:hypothetical protein